MKSVGLIAAGAGLLLAGHAGAAPFGSFDARSAGMGDVGVATSTLLSAPFFNPAMLAAPAGDDNVAVLLPMAGARVGDPDGLIDDVDDFQDVVDSDPAAAQAILVNASGKAVLANANVGGAVAFSVAGFSAALSYNRYASYGGTTTLDAVDVEQSTLDVIGLEATEIGLTLARRFGNLSVGVTPKSVSVTTYDYSDRLATVDTDDLIDGDNERDEGSNVNIDLGLAYDLGANLRLGVVGRNLSSQDYRTVNGNTVSLEPQYRAGLAYNGSLVTLGVDYDLSENDPVSFDQPTRMLGVGLELDAFGWAQLRFGYQTNTADVDEASEQEFYSAGLGLSPFGLQLDLAVSGNDDSVGAFAQLAFGF